jgi:hypothetical protein
VIQTVSSTAESPRYRRRVSTIPSTSRSNDPPVPPATRRPNNGGESNRGKHIQSMEPWLETSAAVRVSPSRPWSPIGGTSVDITDSRYPIERLRCRGFMAATWAFEALKTRVAPERR